MNKHLKNPSQILEEKSQQDWSGCLMITEAKDNSTGWKIYFSEGKIQYATSTVAQKERLTYLWQVTKTKLAFPKVPTQGINYQQLCQWSAQQNFSETDFKRLLLELTKEGLNQVLTIEQTSITIINVCLSRTPVTNFTWQDLIQKDYIDSWKKVRAYLDSPLSLLYLDQNKAFDFYKSWKNITQKNSDFAAFAETQKISDFVNPLFDKICLYDLASRLGIDYLTMAKYLHIFFEQGLIKSSPYNVKITRSSPKYNSVKSVINQEKKVASPVPKNKIVPKNKEIKKTKRSSYNCLY